MKNKPICKVKSSNMRHITNIYQSEAKNQNYGIYLKKSIFDKVYQSFRLTV